MAYIGTPFYPLTTQNAAYTDTAGVITNATDGNTQVVRIVCSTDAYIAFGSAPTATTSDIFIKGGEPEYFLVKGATKVSAIQSASGGTLSVTEMSR